MKVLFLISTFIPMILTARAQRRFEQYTCQIDHAQNQTAFYLSVGEKKEIILGGWKLHAGIGRDRNKVILSLARIVNVLDATYEKEAKNEFPLSARNLPVELVHHFGGKTDVFKMVCYPRDP
jgi:hypothetical protein